MKQKNISQEVIEKQCYSIIFDILLQIQISKEERTKLFDLISNSNEKSLEMKLYERLIQSNQIELLLNMKNHVEEFLKNRPQNRQILYLYYKEKQMDSKASETATALALDNSIELDVSERMQYLSKALILAKDRSDTDTISVNLNLIRVQYHFVQKYAIKDWEKRAVDSKEMIQFAKQHLYYDLYLIVLYYMDKRSIITVNYQAQQQLKPFITKAYRAMIETLADEKVVKQQLVEVERELRSNTLYFPLTLILSLLIKRGSSLLRDFITASSQIPSIQFYEAIEKIIEHVYGQRGKDADEFAELKTDDYTKLRLLNLAMEFLEKAQTDGYEVKRYYLTDLEQKLQTLMIKNEEVKHLEKRLNDFNNVYGINN